LSRRERVKKVGPPPFSISDSHIHSQAAGLKPLVSGRWLDDLNMKAYAMTFDEPDYSTTLPYSMLPGDRLLSL
jgi:hypothetical protein